jgi:hypothetical protein
MKLKRNKRKRRKKRKGCCKKLVNSNLSTNRIMVQSPQNPHPIVAQQVVTGTIFTVPTV